MFSYSSIAELVEAAEKSGRKISELVLADQAEALEQRPEELFDKMSTDLDVMSDAVKFGSRKDQKSTSGLTGGEGWKMNEYVKQTGGGLAGTFLNHAIARALSVAGCNASMGRIVATPTAGSCGILPGCLLTMLEEKGADRKDVIMSIFTAGAFGMVIAQNACIAGAQGGCQAECGSASGMAAAALVELAGGTPRQAADACAMAIANQLGLVCDPVAGLVEIPCIKQNHIPLFQWLVDSE
jgi:L-serine dehydratase